MNRSAAAAGRWRSRTEAGAVPVVELGVVACLLLLLPVVPRGVADPVADAFLWLNVPVVGSLVAAVLLAVLAAALGAAQASRPTHADPAVGIRAGLRRGGRSGDRGRTHRRAQPGANAAAAPRWTAGHATVSAALAVALWSPRASSFRPARGLCNASSTRRSSASQVVRAVGIALIYAVVVTGSAAVSAVVAGDSINASPTDFALMAGGRVMRASQACNAEH